MILRYCADCGEEYIAQWAQEGERCPDCYEEFIGVQREPDTLDYIESKKHANAKLHEIESLDELGTPD